MNYILTCVFVLFFLNAHSKKQLLVLEWKFNGIEEGYDYLNRSKIIVDGEEMPVSKSFRQSEWGSYELRLSKSTHKIKLINQAYCKGMWMEHAFENEFSIDAVCEFGMNGKEVSKVQIVFDLNGKPTSITRFDKKGLEIKPLVFKGKHLPLTIDWKFINIEPGFDHLSRFCIYVDDMKLVTSNESLESAGGSFEVMIPKGKHQIRIVSECLRNSIWQEHTILNDFSVDVVLEQRMIVSKAQKLKWVIDLNNELTVVQWSNR
nr:hypothetical protein [uncultured Fluviicola sp.]